MCNMSIDDQQSKKIPTCLKVIGGILILIAVPLVVTQLSTVAEPEQRLEWAEYNLADKNYADCLANLKGVDSAQLDEELKAAVDLVISTCRSELAQQ